MDVVSTSVPSFLERYVDPVPIRSRSAYNVVAARRADDGGRCTVVLPGASANPRRIGEALAEVERTHALLDHPRIPKVAFRGEAQGTPFLELACDAVVDGQDVVRAMADSTQKIPYGAADGFIVGLRTAMQAAHAQRDPRTGGPICLGRISTGNVLFNAEGRFFLVGFGRNFPVEKDDGTSDGTLTPYQAPELAMQGSASPMGDYVALVLFMRSLMPYVDISDAVGRIVRGELQPSDAELVDCLRWVEQRVLGELPALRASMEEAIEVADRIRACVGAVPEPEAFEAHVAALIGRGGARTGAELMLTLGQDAAWVAGSDGERRRLGRAQRRILLALVEKQKAGSGEPLTMWELLEAGWPGERPSFEVGANRVYVALTRLRHFGLREVIERFEDGYRLAPKAMVRVVD
ncbi:hypothetical protein [Polyangium jinanense]|uniref:Protein kinase domain-containing protein n=1 Tax=Polyangium jinanense TaxID=2829994 RepID=A0A9X3WWW3_9BACT|nr:hypothetical protein [Polyangium jinanense]MDC3953115.1 hypothetical protein [Polyangium jinanense]MDC3979764.1 hypothetical protein [Polyangium jinanense]